MRYSPGRVRFFYSVIALIFLIVLSSGIEGCGGTSGGGFVSVNSLDGAAAVPVDSSFKYSFAQFIDPSSVSGASYFIVPASNAAAQFAKASPDPTVCDPAGALPANVNCPNIIQCDLAPEGGLEGDTRYSICLTTDIEYLNGQPFTGFMATFTTAGSAPFYTIGGTATGLGAGEEVILQNNGADDLSIIADGSFTFATGVADGAAYAVTVFTAPAGKTCTVDNGTGTVSGANVTNVGITCATNSYNIGGTVSGLDGTVVLQNNGGDDLTINANGPFTFATKIASGSTYNAAVRTQPSTQVCNITNGSGTVGAADVTDIAVACNYGGAVIFSTTTASFSGNLGGIAGADALCDGAANRPDSRCYRALIVDGTNRVACTTPFCGGGPGEHVDWVLVEGTSYYRPGLAIRIGTTNANGLFTFPLENAMVADSSLIWTGFTVMDPAPVDWTTGNDCVDWTSDGAVNIGSYGASGDTSDHSMAAALAGCDITYANLICVSRD